MPNTRLKEWQNIRKVIGDMKLMEYHYYNFNIRCHDLCTPPPNNMEMLLGLCSKLYEQTKKLDENAFNNILSRFKHDSRAKQHVQEYIGICEKKNLQTCTSKILL